MRGTGRFRRLAPAVLALVALGLAPAPAGEGDVPRDWLEGDDQSRAKRFADLNAGDEPPPLKTGEWLNGSPLDLADLKGKVVVLDFWATWCGPCIASIPKNNALHETYKDDGLVFIGVCHSQGVERMGSVVEEHGIAYPVAADVDFQTTGAYAVDSYPDYYIIDRSGKLRVLDCANAKVEEAIKALLAEQAAAE